MKKKEFIKFLVEECYSNFPELVDKFSKENMYKILNNNIKAIRTSDNPHAIYDGAYSTETGIIEIYGINDISLDALKKNIKGVKNTVVHESIHALFKNGVHNTGCNLVRRGISIKGFVQDHIYIASDEEKSDIYKQLKINSDKLEREKRQLYNPDNLFRNNKVDNIGEVSLVEVKAEKWFKKIYLFFKKILKK